MTSSTKQPNCSIAASGFFALDLVLDSNERLVSKDLGGSAGNVLAILSTLGWDSFPVAELGRDRAGEELRRRFEELSVNPSFLRSSENVETPVVFQLLEGELGSTPRYTFSCPSCGRKRSASGAAVSDALVDDFLRHNRADVFYFDRTTPVHVKLASRLRQAGTFVFFEPSGVPADKDLFQQALLSANVVKYSSDRIDNLEDFEINQLEAEICTLGGQGLKFRTASFDRNWLTVASNRVEEVVDTCGAGDWCSAGIIFQLFRGYVGKAPPQLTHGAVYSAIQFGQGLSALNCRSLGARGLSRELKSTTIRRIGNQVRNQRLDMDPKAGVFVCEHLVAQRRTAPGPVDDSDRGFYQAFCCYTAF